MPPSFYILPGLALVFYLISVVLNDSFPRLPWVSSTTSLVAAVTLIFWVYREVRVFKKIWTSKKTSKAIGLLLLMLLALGAVLLSNRPRYNRSIDLTYNKKNSLSEESRSLVKRLISAKKQVAVKAFFVSPKIQNNFNKKIQQYLEIGAPMVIDFIDPQIDVIKAKANRVTQPHVVIFTLDGKEERINVFNEENISNAMIKLLSENNFNILFTTGHGEPSIDSEMNSGLKLAADALKNEGYSIASLDLNLEKTIPQSTDLLIVVGPKVNVPIAELKEIKEYLRKGGALLVLLDAMRPSDSINQLLEPYGLEFAPDFIVLHSEDPKVKTYGQNAAMIDTASLDKQMGFTFYTQGSHLFLSDTRSLASTNEGVDAYFPLVTDSKALQINEVYSEEDLVRLVPSRLKQGPFNVMGLVSTGSSGDEVKHNYIIAIGSSQFILNDKFFKPENRQLFLKSVNYSLRNSNFVSLSHKRKLERRTLEIVSKGPVVALGLLCFVYPFAYLMIGAIIWYRRKEA